MARSPAKQGIGRSFIFLKVNSTSFTFNVIHMFPESDYYFSESLPRFRSTRGDRTLEGVLDISIVDLTSRLIANIPGSGKGLSVSSKDRGWEIYTPSFRFHYRWSPENRNQIFIAQPGYGPKDSGRQLCIKVQWPIPGWVLTIMHHLVISDPASPWKPERSPLAFLRGFCLLSMSLRHRFRNFRSFSVMVL